MSRRAVAALLALAFVLACFAFWPETAGAEEPHLLIAKCFPSAWVEQAAAGVAKDDGTTPIDITGPAAQRYLDVYNADPPVSRLKAARIILVPRKTGGPTLSLFLDGMAIGCIIGRVRPEVHERALEASKETPA